jgi:hypothetical protein
MASLPRARGWELNQPKDKKGLTRGTHIEADSFTLCVHLVRPKPGHKAGLEHVKTAPHPPKVVPTLIALKNIYLQKITYM